MTIQRTDTGSRNLSVRIAKSDEEIYEAQRLRYRCLPKSVARGSSAKRSLSIGITSMRIVTT